MKRLLRYFSGIVPFLAAELIQVIIVNGMALVFSFVIGFQIAFENASKGSMSKSEVESLVTKSLTPEMLYLFGFLGVLICGIVFFFWYRIEIRGEAVGSIRSIFKGKNIGMLLLLGIGCQFLFTGLLSILQPYFNDLFTNYADQLSNLTSGNDIIVVILIVLVAPISEELIFRGVILHKANKAMPFLAANLLQAALFGIYHWNIVQGVYAAFIGFILGITYRRFRSIHASILLHMIINSSAFLAFLLPAENIAYVLSALGGVTLIVIAILLLKPSRMLNSEEIR